MGEIDKMIADVHANAGIKGFYADVENLLLSDYLTDKQKKFVKDAVISQRLMLIASELGEALESVRKDKYARLDLVGDSGDIISKSVFEERFLSHVKDTVEDELADAFIRILDLAGFLKIDLERHVKLKHQYNLTRPFMHGKKF